MRFIWHEPKRQANLAKHDMDFADAERAFAGPTFTFADNREDYGEQRWITLGLLREQVVVIVHTETAEEIRVISMREANKVNNSSSSPTSDERDEYPRVTQADMDRATFRVGLKAAPRKQRVTILLDTGLIEYFKAKAGERGYQTLINDTLRQSIERDDLEELLRRVIREELEREVQPATA